MKNSDFVGDITEKTLARLASAPLPARASFVIVLNIKVLSEATALFHKKRIELVQKYAKKDEKGELVRPVNGDGSLDSDRAVIGDEASYHKELGELLNVEPEIKITKLRPEQFGDVALTPTEMNSILWMIEGE